ncbi:MAG: tetratricopeptide repeat protein, partial [bacterium]|nr:tetratricopeptide repeat protein [bacterium]
PIYGISLENFKVMLKTFHSAFPTSAIFYDKNSFNHFALLVGVKQRGLKFDFDKIIHQINNLNARANVDSPILTNVYETLDCFLFGPEVFMQLMAGVSVNSLNQPILQFSSPNTSKNPNNFIQLLHLFNSSRESVYRYVTNIKPETAPRQLVKFKIESYYKSSDYIFNALIAQQLKKEKKVVYFYQQAYRINRTNHSARKFLDDYYNPLLIAEPKTAFELTENAKIFFQKTEHEEAILLLLQAIEQDKNYAPAYFALGLNYEALGDLSAASEMYKKTLELQPGLKIVQQRLESITKILAKEQKGIDEQLPEIE